MKRKNDFSLIIDFSHCEAPSEKIARYIQTKLSMGEYYSTVSEIKPILHDNKNTHYFLFSFGCSFHAEMIENSDLLTLSYNDMLKKTCNSCNNKFIVSLFDKQFYYCDFYETNITLKNGNQAMIVMPKRLVDKKVVEKFYQGEYIKDNMSIVA